MINFPLIGIAAGLVLCAVIAKVLVRRPEKASKGDKAEIMRQLLAKSQSEIKIPLKTPAVRPRTAVANQKKPSGNNPQTKPQTAVPAVRSSKA